MRIICFLASGPRCPGFDSQCYQIFSEEKIIIVAEVDQQRCLEESGQWLENVDQSHLVLAMGSLVLQNTSHLQATKLPSFFVSMLTKLI